MKETTAWVCGGLILFAALVCLVVADEIGDRQNRVMSIECMRVPGAAWCFDSCRSPDFCK